MNHCKSRSQIASSVCNKWISLTFKFAAVLHKSKRKAAHHLNLVTGISKSNYLQRKHNDAKLSVIEHFHNEGLFYYIPIEDTLKAIFGVFGIADIIDRDYYCKFNSNCKMLDNKC